MVGSVVVKKGEVIAEGYHQKAGEPHAEINALTRAGKKARGATLYLNLEPCSHHGRTSPCVGRIIEAGIKRVVIGMVDPNPLVKGKGIRKLRRAGIEVTTGILKEESRRLKETYIKYITTGLPFIILKMGMSLDGRITSPDGRWITGQESRKEVHRLRSQVDAILVGRGTVIKDDPQLTTRLVKGKDPARIILDEKAGLPLKSRVITESPAIKTIIVTTKLASKEKIEKLKAKGVVVLAVKEKNGQIDLKALLKKLGKLKISSLLVEGGARVTTSFLKEGLVDKVMFFVSPKIIGGEGLVAFTNELPLIRFKEITHKKVGEDILITGYTG